MAIIDNWAFVGTSGAFDFETNRSKYKTCFVASDPLKVELGSKWTSVCGVAQRFGDQRDGRLVYTAGIAEAYEDHVITNDGKIHYLGKMNPNYHAFKLAQENDIPILREVVLTRDFNGYLNICGHFVGNNYHKVFKKIAGQDVQKNVLYFTDDSKAFVDWTGAKFNDKIMFEIISKKIGFKEFVGLSIIPIF